MLFRPILAAILLVAASSLGLIAYRALDRQPGAHAVAAPPPVVKILVANQPLQAGTLLKDADFREREIRADAIPEGTLIADEDTRTEIRGSMLRRYLEMGDGLRRLDVLRPRDRGFLAAVLAPGTRAVSIGVDAKSGASGLISPGDLVDVILTQEFSNADTPAGHRVAAETVLSMARVIAVDQQIAQGAPTGTLLPNIGANRVASTVSLQVTPEQAARVVVAERLGRLTLSLRSIDGDHASAPAIAEIDPKPSIGAAAAASAESPKPGGAVFGSDVSAALSKDQQPAVTRLRLIQGDNVSDVVFR